MTDEFASPLLLASAAKGGSGMKATMTSCAAHQTLTRKLSDLRSDLDRAMIPEASSHGDEADCILHEESRELTSAQRSRLLEALHDTTRALERISLGAYGICVDCGEGILARRLKILPCAERCIGCQSAWERSLRHIIHDG